MEKIKNFEGYVKLKNLSVKKRFQYIVNNNKYFLIPDFYWKKIYKKINDDNNFLRYYSLIFIAGIPRDQIEILKSLFVNDELWKHLKKLSKVEGLSGKFEELFGNISNF